MSEHDQTIAEAVRLRQQIAVRAGLPPEASTVLAGTTVDELEGQAAELAKLVAASGPSPQGNASAEQSVGDVHPPREAHADPPAGILATAHAEKLRRKRAIFEALHGRPEQPRDEHGR